jgi:starch phosphorylase
MAQGTKNREKLWALLDRVQKVDLGTITQTFAHHLEYQVGKYKDNVTSADVYQALALTVRNTLIDRWNETRELHRVRRAKRVYYLSMEFLLGRLLDTTLVNLGMRDVAARVLGELGDDLEDLREEEHDAGLGNGGLGRLAACFLESMATLDLAATGAGIRYELGMFQQRIDNGWQREVPDAWLRRGCPWEIPRHDLVFPVHYYGSTSARAAGPSEARDWAPGQTILAMAHDILVPGFDTRTVVNLRLYGARAATELHLEDFNSGDYMRAAEEKIRSENISKVLYPSDAVTAGRELRLMQEYFLVSATLQDALATFRAEEGDAFDRLPERVFFQLNDTHPVLAIPELMRVLVDVHGVPWDDAWRITRACIGYTNHTVMPEALEHWELDLLARLLPRHLEIALLLNHRFLEDLRAKGFDDARIRALSLVDEGPPKKLRMASLAVVGSNAVNGVAALHSDILRESLFREFHMLWPTKIQNKTNGIAHRRWLLAANPDLADVISRRIGKAWMLNLARAQELEAFADDRDLFAEWRAVRARNKERLARIIAGETGIVVDPKSLFDVHVKRIHEYKRQLLNAMRALGDFVRMKESPSIEYTPRTLVFAGKAAPAYTRAKRIVRLIHAIGALVNDDPDVAGRLKVVFLPDYRVSLAERIFPAADLSEQISTAGTEASGTGNMKFMLNGALTIGTLDGANVEILEEVGEENFYLFGARVEEIAALWRAGYDPRARIAENRELSKVIELLGSERLAPRGELDDLVRVLMDEGDRYLLALDYPSYVEAQARVARDFLDVDAWTRRSILNTARCGKFSSDRTVREYASEIWGASAIPQRAPRVRAL